MVSQSPRECGYAFSRWTANWLSRHLQKELGIAISDRHINRLLKQMGLSTRDRQSESENKIAAKPSQNCSIVIGNLREDAEPESSNFSLFPALNN